MADNAGTVASFDGTTLTIQLASGSTVSGTVTNDTEIECVGASTSQPMDSTQPTFHRDDQSGDQSSGGDQSGVGSDQGDDNDNDDNNSMQTCGPTSLTTGAIVHEAELSLTGASAVWNKVVLLTSSSSSSSSGSSTSSGGND